MTNLRGSFPPRRLDAARPASSVNPPVGAAVFVVAIDETTGRADCRPGYRIVAGVELDARGRRVVTVVTEAQWLARARDENTGVTDHRPTGQKWPADLVWTREGGDLA